MENRINKIKNTLSKSKKYLLGIAIVLISIAVSIRSSDGEIKLVLQNYPALIFLLVVTSLFLVAIYFRSTIHRITDLSSQIEEHSKNTGEEFDNLLNELTERQREVYDLIISGKANKEIMSELFIEQSTLKSHVNQIYKKLNIKSRNELKSKSK